MTLSPNQRVARAFAAHAADYEHHACLQARIAAQLASLLPQIDQAKILEIGCGTGFLTRHLVDHYNHCDFLITDLAPEMVERCRTRYQSINGRAIRFAVMDGEAPECKADFGLIAMSMTLQWFTDPVSGLQRLKDLLKPGGFLLYATLAPDSCPEWSRALDVCGLRHGMISMPELPGVIERESCEINYGNAIAFLRALRSIGANTPRPGYAPLPPGNLRAALRRLEKDHGARVTWRIVYGLISA